MSEQINHSFMAEGEIAEQDIDSSVIEEALAKSDMQYFTALQLVFSKSKLSADQKNEKIAEIDQEAIERSGVRPSLLREIYHPEYYDVEIKDKYVEVSSAETRGQCKGIFSGAQEQIYFSCDGLQLGEIKDQSLEIKSVWQMAEFVLRTLDKDLLTFNDQIKLLERKKHSEKAILEIDDRDESEFVQAKMLENGDLLVLKNDLETNYSLFVRYKIQEDKSTFISSSPGLSRYTGIVPLEDGRIITATKDANFFMEIMEADSSKGLEHEQRNINHGAVTLERNITGLKLLLDGRLALSLPQAIIVMKEEDGEWKKDWSVFIDTNILGFQNINDDQFIVWSANHVKLIKKGEGDDFKSKILVTNRDINGPGMISDITNAQMLSDGNLLVATKDLGESQAEEKHRIRLFK